MTLSDDALLRENEKLRKINRVLMDRVERSTDAQGNAFSLFQAAITLEKMVQQRTGELQVVNRQLRDEISERAEIELALGEAKVAAERANMSKTKFLAAASHDLLQPLNVARLFIDALAERTIDPQSAGMIERIDSSLETAESLLSSLLDMSKLDAGAMSTDREHFALDPLLDRLRNEYSLAAEERNLRFRVVPSDAVVYTDRLLLERILRNFISNAMRYTGRGGLLLGCRRRDPVLRIELWDTGIGIAADRLEEIFEEFKQLDSPVAGKPGLGLGLAIVERIARLLELKIGVRSRSGRGSVFSVDVPLGDNPASGAGNGANLQLMPNPLRGKTVLVVDDDDATLEGMSVVLQSWGCLTVRARSVEHAIVACKPLETGLDFVIADYHLDGSTTGLDAIGSVAHLLNRPVAAVVVTADHTDETKSHVTGHGYWYLNKPIRIDRLRSLMSHVLA